MGRRSAEELEAVGTFLVRTAATRVQRAREEKVERGAQRDERRSAVGCVGEAFAFTVRLADRRECVPPAAGRWFYRRRT